MPAASIAERDEQQDQRRQPGEQLGLVEGLLVDLVEVAPHRPLAGDLGSGARRQLQRTDVVPEIAGSDWAVGVVFDRCRDRDERGVSIGEISPASGGSVADRRRHELWARANWVSSRAGRLGVIGNRGRLVVDDDGVLGPELREVLPQLGADLLRSRALGIPPGSRAHR